MEINLFISFFIYVCGLMVYGLNRKHFLLMLLSLEMMMLGILLSMFMFLNFSSLNMYLFMIYLTLVVCEGVLGLSIMVLLIRCWGSDNILSYSILW